MQRKWWGTTACLVCGFWREILLCLIMGLLVYLTRDMWLPGQGLNSKEGLVDGTVRQRNVELGLKDNGTEVDGDRI